MVLTTPSSSTTCTLFVTTGLRYSLRLVKIYTSIATDYYIKNMRLQFDLTSEYSKNECKLYDCSYICEVNIVSLSVGFYHNRSVVAYFHN